MEGKVFGLPLVLIVLVVLILAPLVALDLKMMQSLSSLQAKAPVQCVVAQPTPSVSPSVTPVERGVRGATTSGQAR